VAAAEKNIRAFLAIEPPEDLLQTVIRLQEKLKREISGRLSWTKPGRQHLTLKFFGDVSAGDVDQISRILHNRLQFGAAIRLKIEKLGAIHRVTWKGLPPCKNRWRRILPELGFPKKTALSGRT
jgi:2'-5' RNA ligase